jgi:hypothetical protein
MEIVSIILDGALEHRDSLGNVQVIKQGEVQVMSAGTGVYHAEYNHSKTEAVKFFQLWIFPREKGLKPRYDQMLFADQGKQDQLVTLVTPDTKQSEGALWIHQDAYISTIRLNEEIEYEYQVRFPGNGVFVFNVEGKINLNGTDLSARDAMGVSETESFQIKAKNNSKVLFIEVPMR